MRVADGRVFHRHGANGERLLEKTAMSATRAPSTDGYRRRPQALRDTPLAGSEVCLWGEPDGSENGSTVPFISVSRDPAGANPTPKSPYHGAGVVWMAGAPAA